jgi:hypothetical protein
LIWFYINVFSCVKSDSRWGFGLEIGLTDHLQVITTNYYNTSLNSTLYKSLQQTLGLFSLLCLHKSFPGNGFHQRRFFNCTNQVFPSQTPLQLSNFWTCLGYNISAWTMQKTPFIVVLQLFLWERVCLQRHYSVMDAHTFLLRICYLAATVVLLFQGHYPITGLLTTLLPP